MDRENTDTILSFLPLFPFFMSNLTLKTPFSAFLMTNKIKIRQNKDILTLSNCNSVQPKKALSERKLKR